MNVAERAVFFPAGADTLFGVLAGPDVPAGSDLAVVVLPAAVPGGIRGHNGVLVRLARAVAEAGYASFRFDYRGVGESTGSMPRARRDAPFLDDLDAALEWLRGHGYRRFLVAGSCFGAQTALLAVPGRTDVCGVALLSCLVAAQDESPTPPSRLVLAAVAEAAERGVAVLFCYGRLDPYYVEFETARPFGLEAALAGTAVDLEVLDGAVHSFLDVKLQPRVIELVVGWLEQAAGRLPHVTTAGQWTSR